VTTPRVAAVIVTYNRCELLPVMLAGLAAQTRPVDQVIVVNNASTDLTAEVLEAYDGLPLQVIESLENLGGAGGFERGMRAAFEQGYEWMWLMDDDVVPAPDCLEQLLRVEALCLISVREDSSGRLVEKAATKFDLRSPFALRPKRSSIETDYQTRAAMPPTVLVENLAFEGFLVHQRVVSEIGFPDPDFFIFYDDVDFAIRARRAGFAILAVRDARLVRQLDFNQQHALDSWKGFYMYRNLFVVHLRHGENVVVRAKPWAIALGVTLVAPLRGGFGEVRNVWRALFAANRMRLPRHNLGTQEW
jgi:rhamnopyranosyl-N-acetylglucosaminyl-diphospho-decaprenol beta-1,3/1,4-galactofuranosyltransferase